MCLAHRRGLDRCITLNSLHKLVNSDDYPTEAREAKRVSRVTRPTDKRARGDVGPDRSPRISSCSPRSTPEDGVGLTRCGSALSMDEPVLTRSRHSLRNGPFEERRPCAFRGRETFTSCLPFA